MFAFLSCVPTPACSSVLFLARRVFPLTTKPNREIKCSVTEFVILGVSEGFFFCLFFSRGRGKEEDREDRRSAETALFLGQRAI